MFITDLNGLQITVTDLPAAIKQADNFRHFKHEDREMQKMDADLNAYWQDVFNKLQKISL